MKRWTAEEDAELRRLIEDGVGAEAMARQLGRPVWGVHNRRQKLGLVSKRQRFWTEAEEAIVAAAIERGQSCKDIADRLSRSESATLQKIHAMGLSLYDARWNERDIARMAALRATGTSVEDIAAELGKSLVQVKKKMTKLGIRSPKYRPWTADDNKRLRSLHSEGVTVPVIARILGRTVQATYHRCAEIGLSRQMFTGRLP